jgi:cytochrome c-type biogenesis protein CcmH
MSLYLFFVLMLGVSLAWVLWFLYRPIKQNSIDLNAENIAIAQQKLKELEKDLTDGLLSELDFESSKQDLSQVLALELDNTDTSINTQTNKRFSLIFLVFFLPATSIFLYQNLSQTINHSDTMQGQQAPKKVFSLQEGIEKIHQHLEKNPQDFEAWQMLGLSYFETNELEKSVAAYEKSYQINPKNPRLLIELASTLVTQNNNVFSKRPVSLIKQALEIDSKSPDALYLAGMFAVSQQDFKLAKQLWQRAMSVLPKDSEDARAVQNMLLELQAVNAKQSFIQEINHDKNIQVSVNLSEKIIKQQGNDFIMIYAKSAQGRPMPIAIQKIRVKDFTGQITLSDKDSVMPTRKLSSHDKVIVVVRISRTGRAMRQPKDKQVQSAVLSLGLKTHTMLEVN